MAAAHGGSLPLALRRCGIGKGLKSVVNIGLGVGSLFASGGTSGLLKGLGFMALGGLLSSSQRIEGQRLNDLGVQLAQEGAELIKGWGTWRQSFTLVYSSGLKEHKHSKHQGKGGPKVTNYTYGTKAVLLGGRGPITRLNRVKLNQYTIYDWNGGNEKGMELEFADGHWSGENDDDLKLRVYPGTLNQPVATILESAKGVGNWTAYPNQWYVELEVPDLNKYGNTMPTVTAEAFNAVTSLTSIIPEIGSWVNYPLDGWDLSALAGLTVAPHDGEGFTVDSRKSAASCIGELMEMYHFSLPSVDGVRRAVLRPTGRVTLLVSDVLKVRAGFNKSTGGSSSNDAPLKGADENALPEVQEVITRDPEREHQPGYSYARRLETGSKRKESGSYSTSMRSGRRTGLARTLLAEKWAKATTVDAQLGIEHLYLAAGDEVGVETPDGVQDFTLSQVTTPFFGALPSQCIGFDPLLYGLPEPADTSGLDRNSPETQGAPVVFAGECPAPSSSTEWFSKPGFIVALARLPGDDWDSCVVNVDRQKDDGSWKEIKEFTVSDTGLVGELTASFTPAAPEAGYDATAELNCKVFEGALHNAEPDAVRDGANLLLFETGLLVSYVTATQTGTVDELPYYTLSTLKSGRFGSDDLNEGALPAGTRFVRLSDEEGLFDDAVKWAGVDSSRIGDILRLRVTRGTHLSTVDFGQFHARNVEPPSPVLVVAEKLDDGSLHLRGRARERNPRDNGQNNPQKRKLDEPQFGGKYKYRLTLTSVAQSVIKDLYTDDEQGSFDFTLTEEQINALFDVPPTTLTGTLALYGAFGPGRTAIFTL